MSRGPGSFSCTEGRQRLTVVGLVGSTVGLSVGICSRSQTGMVRPGDLRSTCQSVARSTHLCRSRGRALSRAAGRLLSCTGRDGMQRASVRRTVDI